MSASKELVNTYSTENCEKLLNSGEEESIPDDVMVDKKDRRETLDDLYKDIIKEYESISKFAKKFGMAHNYLSEIFNMTKTNPHRDIIIVLCRSVGYDLEKTRSILRHLVGKDLYVKDKRDLLIMKAIRNGYDIEEINDLLGKEGHDFLPIGKE